MGPGSGIPSLMLRFRRTALLLLCVVWALSLVLRGQQSSAAAPKREHFQNAEITYSWVYDSRGNRLRTFVTQPKGVVGKVPAIFFVVVRRA